VRGRGTWRDSNAVYINGRGGGSSGHDVLVVCLLMMLMTEWMEAMGLVSISSAATPEMQV